MCEIITCPHCGIEIVNESAVCPSCNAVINEELEREVLASKVPTLDDNSGRIQSRTGFGSSG